MKRLIAALLLVIAVAAVYGVVWYHRFYHHVTPEELSHEVRHSTFEATLRGGPPLKLQLYQQANAANQPLLLFTSGDGGWSPFCADVAAHIASRGITVVGIDIKQYLVSFATPQKPISAEQLTSDYDSIARLAVAQPGIDRNAPMMLAGWSLGAGYSVIVATQPEFSPRLSRVVAIGLPAYGERAWKPADAIIYITDGRPRESAFDVRQYLKKLNQTPIVFLNATHDKNAPFSEAQSLYDAAAGAKRFYTVNAGDHHFKGGEKEFYQDLDQGLTANS